MADPLFTSLKVVELASVLAGPSVGQFFAELGAQVLKVENASTRGDVTRSWKLASEDSATDTPAYFWAANWGKEALALNLAEAEGLQRLYGFIQEADMVVASYKPGDAEKLRVDYATLRRLNPRLVYGHVTGYGPASSRAGYDAVVQAESGFMYLNGEPGGEPTKMPVALMDVLAAHQLKEGLLVALLQRERTGIGQLVEVSLLDAAVSALANQATAYLVAGQNPQRLGSGHPSIVPYGTVYTTSDAKQLVLAVGNDQQFSRLCSALGAPELANDTKYSTNRMRVQNREELNRLLQQLISGHGQQALLLALQELHVPAGPVNSVQEVFEMPQAKHMLLQHPNTKPGLRQVAFRLSTCPLQQLKPPPSYNNS